MVNERNSSKITTPELIPPKYRKWIRHRRRGFPIRTYVHEAYRQIWLIHIEPLVEKYAIHPYKFISLLDMGEDLYNKYNEVWAEISPN